MAHSLISISDLTPDLLDQAAALSRQAGWPHRREDWAFMLGFSRGFAALADGRLVGTAQMTPYGTDAAAINMVIVAEAMRGRGLGRRLMDVALAAADGRECRLTATANGLPLYQKLGFAAVGDIAQHQGHVTVTSAPAQNVRWAAPADLPAVLPTLGTLDRAACGMDRTALLAALAQAGRIAILRKAGDISGFAVLRAFGRGEVAGPVVAADAADARDLLSVLFAARPGAFLRVDTPQAAALGDWLAAQGLARAGGGTPMVRAPITPAPARVRTFALASQALG